MFSRLARRYDLVNDVMSFGMHRVWKRQTVRLALAGRPPRSARVLDLCCGSGDLCFLAEELGAARSSARTSRFRCSRWRSGAGRAVGAPDPAAQAAGGTAFVQADALRLPFRDGSFDVLTVGYGLRNVADIPAALAEMRRVLAPGGRAVVLDFGKPDSAAAGRALPGLSGNGDARGRLDLPRRPADLRATSPPRSSAIRRNAASRR